jgi:hypothetical protein
MKKENSYWHQGQLLMTTEVAQQAMKKGPEWVKDMEFESERRALYQPIPGQQRIAKIFDTPKECNQAVVEHNKLVDAKRKIKHVLLGNPSGKLCSGYKVFPDGELCSGCRDCIPDRHDDKMDAIRWMV